MGSGQSAESTSTAGGSKPTGDAPPKLETATANDLDLYGLLQVDKNANEDELKRGYKKQALKLHPDRNFNRVEEATALFAKVQAAYDVLSDPQERAWYDSHGLNGPTGGDEDDVYDSPENVTTSEDLKKYFDPMMYQSWEDGPGGVFQTLGGLFHTLREEEEEATIEQGSREDYELLPEFGTRTSVWAGETKLFYEAWLSFSSKKDFTWHDVHRLRDAPDRRTRRAMENMNQKSRDAARKEFNESVRALVAFIRKRDPRFKAHAKQSGGMKHKNDKANTKASKAQAQRAREANRSNKQGYEEQAWETGATEEFDEFISEDELERRTRVKEKEWKQRRNLRENGGESLKGSDESLNKATSDHEEEKEDEEEVREIFECVVCKKSFKTHKQLVAHEKSKKHIKALQKLQWELKKEGIEFGLHVPEQEKESGKKVSKGVVEQDGPGVAQKSTEGQESDISDSP